MNSVEAFDGADDIRRAWLAGLAPGPIVGVAVGGPAPQAVLALGLGGLALPDQPHALLA